MPDTCSTLLCSLPRCLLPFIRICGETVPVEGLFSVGRVVARAVGSRGGARFPAARSSRPRVQDAPSAPSGGGSPARLQRPRLGLARGFPAKPGALSPSTSAHSRGPHQTWGAIPLFGPDDSLQGDLLTPSDKKETGEGGDKHLQFFKKKK